MKIKSRNLEMSDDDCAYVSSDDEDQHELEIKPPQAKVFKRSHGRRSDKQSHSSSNRHVYVSSSRHHSKSHHSHHHVEDRHAVVRYANEYDKRSQKKAYHHNRPEDRYKEQDLREKLERRKRHHAHDYDRKDEETRKERTRKERHRQGVKEHRNHDERRRHHRDERKQNHSPEEKHVQSVSDDSISPPQSKNIVIDIETSPPVLREEYSDHEREEEIEYEEESRQVEEEEEVEEETDNSESTSNSSSNDSNNSSSGSSNGSGSSSPSSSEGEGERVQENQEVIEIDHVSENDVKEDASPNVTANDDHDNDGIDSEIELEKDTLPSYYPAIQGCRSVEEFQCLNRIEEGTYGVVYRAREKRTDRIVALKRLKMEKEKNGFPITSLREINTLLKAQHPNIVTVKEIVVGSNMDKIFIVMDYVEHDLKSLMETMKSKKTCFTSSEVKCLMLQLLQAVNHLHNNWILHRDLKTSNLLFSHAGILKVGDFGLAREYGSPLKQYTPIVVTLWYRAPELLLGTKEYSTSVDVWSVGCIFAELLCMEPLFPGKTEPDQLKRIFKALGTPNEKIWPEYPKLPLVMKANLPEYPSHGIRSKFVPNILSDVGYNLLTSLLCYNPKKRITAEAALVHDYFTENPLPIDPAMFSTWPAKSEHGRKAASSPKPPSGGQNYKELREDDGFYIGVGERGNHPAGFNAESTFSLKF